MRILMLAILPLLLLGCSAGDSGSWFEKDNSKAAYEITKEFVNQRIINVETATYPSMGWNDKVQVEREGQTQRYVITAYVDSEDAFGEKLRTEFTADVEMVSEDEWLLHDMLLNER